jgi:hypothetical protein
VVADLAARLALELKRQEAAAEEADRTQCEASLLRFWEQVKPLLLGSVALAALL